MSHPHPRVGRRRAQHRSKRWCFVEAGDWQTFCETMLMALGAVMVVGGFIGVGLLVQWMARNW